MGILPIHIAIETDNYDCVKELIVRGAKVNLADKDGRNVFHYAARGNDQRIIQVDCYGLTLTVLDLNY